MRKVNLDKIKRDSNALGKFLQEKPYRNVPGDEARERNSYLRTQLLTKNK